MSDIVLGRHRYYRRDGGWWSDSGPVNYRLADALDRIERLGRENVELRGFPPGAIMERAERLQALIDAFANSAPSDPDYWQVHDALLDAASEGHP